VPGYRRAHRLDESEGADPGARQQTVLGADAEDDVGGLGHRRGRTVGDRDDGGAALAREMQQLDGILRIARQGDADHRIPGAEPEETANRLFGSAVKRTSSAEALDRLARVYWFTIEFGVLREAGTVKAYGTGLLSSAGEVEAMHQAELKPLDADAASRHDYDPTRFQPVLFCADSFQAMYDTIRDHLVRW